VRSNNLPLWIPVGADIPTNSALCRYKVFRASTFAALAMKSLVFAKKRLHPSIVFPSFEKLALFNLV
jgi:hypothetical protein